MLNPPCPVMESKEDAEDWSAAFRQIRNFQSPLFESMWIQGGKDYANRELQALWNLSTPPECRQLMAAYVAKRLTR